MQFKRRYAASLNSGERSLKKIRFDSQQSARSRQCAQTIRLAEDICLARFFRPFRTRESQNQRSEEKERKNHESADSIQKHNNSPSSHRTNAACVALLAGKREWSR